jgi:hypothetical protein
VGVALVWAVYTFFIKDSGIRPDSNVVTVPDGSYESARF